MDEIKIFSNSEFGEIRTVIIDGEPWFVVNDVASSLGYSRGRNSLKHIDDDDKRVAPIRSPLGGGEQETYITNESGMYSLIFGSKLESAKKFKKWVTSEVLPQIRKTGSYGQAKIPMTIPEQIQLLAQGNVELNQRVESVENRIVDLEETMNIDYGQQRTLGNVVNKTVMKALGGNESCAYKKMGRKVFAECNGNLKDFFKVNARANLPKKRYEEAISYAENWKPSTNTTILINQYNAQIHLDDIGKGGV